MDKIDKRYRLLYIKDDGLPTERTATVELPFTLEVEITRNNFGSSNIGQLRLYNISKDRRNFMRKDWNTFDIKDRVILSAGYGDNLVTILDMSVSKAYSMRNGVDFITQIECLDGGYAYLNAKVEDVAPTGTPLRNIIINNAKKLEPFGVTLGVVGSFPGELTRAQPLVGNLVDNLGVLTNNRLFVDNSKFNALGENEAIKGSKLVINPGTGLLSTPMRQQTYVEFEMIFEPQISIGRLIQLESSQGDIDISGEYIVTYLSHRGIFSEAVGGTVTTEIGGQPGAFFEVGEGF